MTGETNNRLPMRKQKYWSNRLKTLPDGVAIWIRCFIYTGRHRLGITAKNTKEESSSWILVPIVERGRNQRHPNSTAIIASVYTANRASSHEQPVTVRTSLPIKEGVDKHVPLPCLCWGSESRTHWMAWLPPAEKYCPPNAAAPIPVSAPATKE